MSDVNDELDGQDLATEDPEEEAAAPEPVPIATGARLVALANGEETEIAFELPEKGTIGRFDPSVGPIEVDVSSAPDSSYVSRRHAEVWTEGGQWKIRDLGSSNGLFLLGEAWERVEEAVLTDGAQIALGNAKFVFRDG